MKEKMSAELISNLSSFCENRAHVYMLLSKAYETEITAEFAEELVDHFSFDSTNADLVEKLKAMQSSVLDRSESALEALAVVFNRVFFGMGPRTAQKAFPYESVYTSPDGIMMQDAYSEVVVLYRNACFQKNPCFAEPEDHLAIELAFMGNLCTAALPYLAKGCEPAATQVLEQQQSFLQNHLQNWIGPFCADMKASAETGFYVSLAECTEAFLLEDARALAEVLN